MTDIKRHLPAALFLTALYTVTVLLAGRDPRPEAASAVFVYELRHIAAHLASFALLSGLVVWAVPRDQQLGAAPLLVCGLLAVVLGAGQEYLQWSNRPTLLVGPLLFDLAVDALGGVLGGAAALTRFHTSEG
jgi:hypothetical protein